MISIIPVMGLPEINEGDDIGALIAAAAELDAGDVVVVSQKIVSKAEGAVTDPPAGLAPAQGRREVARAEATRIVADTPEVLIVETRHGFVCANAGVDASNAGGRLTLLPVDPDASARSIRTAIREAAGVDVAVIVADTFGRPWRVGQTDVAIGVAGVAPIRDERGQHDRDGNVLEVTEVALADELAGAADLVRDKAAGIPVVVVRGVSLRPDDGATAAQLVRPAANDLFRRGRGMLARALAGDPPTTGSHLDVLRAIAPDLQVMGLADVRVVDPGDPWRLQIADRLRAGLVVAALLDLDYDVTWDDGAEAVTVTAGAPQPRR